jgi:amino acid transporter
LAAWVTGWSNFLGLVSGSASINYSCAAMILAAGAIANPSYIPQSYHTFLVASLISVLSAFATSFHTLFIARLNETGTVINTISLVVFLVVVPAASTQNPKVQPTMKVWSNLENDTDWPIGFAVLMSFLAVIWTLSGYDAPFHLCEECSNANIASPRAIVMTSTLGGVLGWLLVLVIGYTVVNVSEVTQSTINQPMGSFLLQVLGRKWGLFIFSLVIVSTVFTCQAIMVASSRVTYAYSRDGALPGSRIWAKVNSWTRTPVYAGSISYLLPAHSSLVNLFY